MEDRTQESQDIRNADSLSRQKHTRERRSAQRAMKDKMDEALRGASSTKDRREIKNKFKVDTNKSGNKTDNQTGVNEDSNQRGDDSFKPSYYEIPDGGGGGLAGIEIIWRDQTIEFIEAADLTDTYNNGAYWSLVLTVSSGSFDKTLTYDATPDIFTTTGTAPSEVQTKYRLRLITQYTNGDGDNVSTGISAYGQYREVTLCVNGSPRQSLIKVT